MSHFIPTLRRNIPSPSLYQNQDCANSMSWIRNRKPYLYDVNFPDREMTYVRDRTLPNRICFVRVYQNDQSVVVTRSQNYGGHVSCLNHEDLSVSLYIGTCEEVYKALRDAIHTEACYATRTMGKVTSDQDAKLYLESQIQVARDFVAASHTAQNEWLSTLNKFVAACAALEIGLPVGGYQPRDLTSRALQCK